MALGLKKMRKTKKITPEMIRTAGKIKDLTLQLPEEKRAGAYRAWLRGHDRATRKKIIAWRKQVSRARKPVFRGIKRAIGEMSKNHPNFKGAILYGSFVKGKMNPRDIDAVPVIFKSPQKMKKSDAEIVNEFLKKIKDQTGLKADANFAKSGAGMAPCLSYGNLSELKKNLISTFGYFSEAAQLLRPWHFVGDSKTKAMITRALEEIRAGK